MTSVDVPMIERRMCRLQARQRHGDMIGMSSGAAWIKVEGGARQLQGNHAAMPKKREIVNLKQ